MVTASGNLLINNLLHMTTTNESNAELKSKLLHTPTIANTHATSTALPFLGFNLLEYQLWNSAQPFVEAVQEFSVRDGTNTNDVCFVCSSLLSADIMRVVSSTLLAATENDDGSIVTNATDNNATNNNSQVDKGDGLTEQTGVTDISDSAQ